MSNSIKTKSITIDTRNSIIEGNLIEIPFLYYNKEKEKVNFVEYKWCDSKGKEHLVEIEGSIKYGLPTPYELDVLLALLRIRARQKEIKYGTNIATMDDIKEDDLAVHFTLNEIAKELNKSGTGAILARIKKSLLILGNTKITSVSTSSVYDPAKKQYITTEEGQIVNLIDRYSWQTKKGSNAVSDKNAAYIGRFFYYSIINSYFKYYDYESYLSLNKNAIAKRLFLLLSKWRNNKTQQTIKLETLYERIPLSKTQEARRKNALIKSGAEALKKIGFIKNYSIASGKITFVYASEKAIEKEKMNKLDKYSLFTQIQERLIELGFTPEEIMAKHINTIVANTEYTKALLRYADDVFESTNITNKKGYIETGLHNFFDIDKSYYNDYTV